MITVPATVAGRAICATRLKSSTIYSAARTSFAPPTVDASIAPVPMITVFATKAGAEKHAPFKIAVEMLVSARMVPPAFMTLNAVSWT